MVRTVLAASLFALMAAPAFARSDDWRETEVSGIGGQWVLREKGELFGDGPYSFVARTERGGVSLELGCYDRNLLDLTFTPPPGATTPDVFTAVFAVNGAHATSITITDAGDVYSVERPGYYGPAEDLAEAMARAWKGDITVSFHEGVSAVPKGPALQTWTVPFDEDEMGGVSEMVLAACQLR